MHTQRNADEAGAREGRHALCPGSFDPPTVGHVDVIRRARGLFDRLTVGVVRNPSKSPLLPASERVDLLRQLLRDLPGVDVVSFDGLTVDLAARLGAGWIVRGIRSEREAGVELTMARTNRTVSPTGVDTLLLPSSPAAAFIAARFVRELAAAGGDVSRLVPPSVEAALRKRFGKP